VADLQVGSSVERSEFFGLSAPRFGVDPNRVESVCVYTATHDRRTERNANLKSDVKDVSSIFDHYRMCARAIWNTAFWPDQDFRNWDSIDQFHQIEKLLFQELVLAKVKIASFDAHTELVGREALIACQNAAIHLRNE
jgi:hypothetical protein